MEVWKLFLNSPLDDFVKEKLFPEFSSIVNNFHPLQQFSLITKFPISLPTRGSSESLCLWFFSTASHSECSSPASTINARKIAVKYYRWVMMALECLPLVELRIKFIHIPSVWNGEEGALLHPEKRCLQEKLWLIFIGPMPVTYKHETNFRVCHRKKRSCDYEHEWKKYHKLFLYADFMQKIN